MKQDKYTIIGLIVCIIILGTILGLRIMARKNNLSLKVDGTVAQMNGVDVNALKGNTDFTKYIGTNLNSETVQTMLTEIESNVTSASKVSLTDRTVITLNLTTNKAAGSLIDYSTTIREYKERDITNDHTYTVSVSNGLTETTKQMTIVIL